MTTCPAPAPRRKRALAFGTVDTFLIWHLTGGKCTPRTHERLPHDAYDIAAGRFDDDLLALFRIPRAILPEVRDCNADFGSTEASHFGAPIAIRGVAGDQQAGDHWQACFKRGW